MKIDRRRFLASGFRVAAGAALPGLVWAPAGVSADSHAKTPSAELLERSSFVYVSPLRSDGAESRCHGEIWYGSLDGEVVAIVSRDGWKARAIRQGLTRARIWVGDHGVWKGFFFNNEAFRDAPRFDAVGSLEKNEDLLGRLMATYRKKYPAEIASWEPRMRAGHADGSRVLVRYRRSG